MNRRSALWLFAICVIGCGQPDSQPIVLASTTSTEDSGLFGVLLPVFAATHPKYQVKLLAVGSGEALELGRRGDADVLLVHSPEAEARFEAEGHAVSRRQVMYNDFVLLGDSSDSARIRGQRDVAVGLAAIATARARFVSRGDQSGTHAKELELWRASGSDPSALAAGGAANANWYVQVGQGMAESLRVANERHAYILSDRGTYLAMSSGLQLQVLVEGDPRLRNPYSVIVVKRAKNAEGARAFAEWITGAQAQSLIRDFGRARFGRPLFVPDAETPG
jgi:tungstate transport system substrate-binding protein